MNESKQATRHRALQLPRWACVTAIIGHLLAPTALLQAAPEAADAKEGEAPELTLATERAIDRGLAYLLAEQSPDGSWGSGENGGFRAAAGTSLALMAFMVKGEFPGFGDHGEQLDLAKDYILKLAEESETGFVGSDMYEHGLYTLVLSELWGMTDKPEDDPKIRKALQRAVDVILRAQSQGGGWRYAPRPDRGQDTSITAMVFIALASARQAGILVPDESVQRVVDYLRGACNEKSGGFSYDESGKTPTLGCSAGGAYAAQLAGQRDTEWVQSSIRYLERRPNVFQAGKNKHYYYAHYYAIQAMVLAGDDHYSKWYPQIRDALLQLQKKDGSWGEGGSPHITPMAIIILGTPHRYLPIYQR